MDKDASSQINKKIKIMVVEDESLLLEAIDKKLTSAGVEVLSCASGKQAVDYLDNLTTIPDAIWLDYHLKDMDGLEFMAELKKHPGWENVPILVVSNSASQDKVTHMLALGASQYVLKAEHRLDEIIGIIENLIKEKNGKKYE